MDGGVGDRRSFSDDGGDDGGDGGKVLAIVVVSRQGVRSKSCC